MPQSKLRKPHHHQPIHKKTAQARTDRAAWVAMILFAVLGFVIGYFASGGEAMPMIVGTILGAVAGYISGTMMDRSLK
ncbi:MAG: hypothetical protein ABIY51_10930 [Ferruginibacter sp.]